MGIDVAYSVALKKIANLEAEVERLKAACAEMHNKIERRCAGTLEFLKSDYPWIFQDQRHLDAGSEERGYWHYGYLSALQDTEKLKESNPGASLLAELTRLREVEKAGDEIRNHLAGMIVGGSGIRADQAREALAAYEAAKGAK